MESKCHGFEILLSVHKAFEVVGQMFVAPAGLMDFDVFEEGKMMWWVRRPSAELKRSSVRYEKVFFPYRIGKASS